MSTPHDANLSTGPDPMRRIHARPATTRPAPMLAPAFDPSARRVVATLTVSAASRAARPAGVGFAKILAHHPDGYGASYEPVEQENVGYALVLFASAGWDVSRVWSVLPHVAR